MHAIITSDHNLGVLFYFGQDSLGHVFLEPIGIDDKSYVMSTATVATSAGIMSWQVAKQCRDRFKQQHPDGYATPWGYFEGSDAVRRLLEQATELVRVELGMNDNSSQTLMFSNAADLEPTSLADNVMPCPSYCGIDAEGVN